MKREFLEKLGLEKEVVDKIMAENGKDIQTEQAKVTEKEKELELATNQLKEANKTIKSYKDMDIEKIKESATEWEGKYKDAQREMEDFKNNATLEKALISYNTIDTEILTKILDRDALKFKDGEIIGLEEQITTIKESKPYLFKTEDTNSNEPTDDRFNAYVPPQNSGGNINTLEQTINGVFND